MFGLKDKLLGKKHHDMDLGDVRSHVLGQNPYPERPMEQQTIGKKFAIDKPLPLPPRRFDQPQNDFPEPFESNPYQEPDYPKNDYPQMQMQSKRLDFGANNEKYEVLDRLNIIESQLSAIRSQTETINERLKNLEVKLTGARRY